MPDPETRPNTAVILERIEGLRCDMGELKSIMATHIADERKDREAYLIEHAAIVQKADAAHRRLDLIEPTVAEMQKSITASMAMQKIQTGVLVFIGSAVGLWIINQFLGLIR